MTGRKAPEDLSYPTQRNHPEANLTQGRYSGDNHTGPGRSSPYPVQRLSAPISLVDTAREIEQASIAVTHRASTQLELIAEQMRALKAQAQRVLQEAKHDLVLHQAECRFQKIPGKRYHLYRRDDGRTYFSMLSPEELQGASRSQFLGTYILGVDQTWVNVEDTEAHTRAHRRERAASGFLDEVLTMDPALAPFNDD